MTQEATASTRTIPRERGGSDFLITAENILIAGRGYGEGQAFDELLDVARHHHITVETAARRLIALSRNQSIEVPAEWVQLMKRIRITTPEAPAPVEAPES